MADDKKKKPKLTEAEAAVEENIRKWSQLTAEQRKSRPLQALSEEDRKELMRLNQSTDSNN